jgi:hypothetical protein
MEQPHVVSTSLDAVPGIYRYHEMIYKIGSRLKHNNDTTGLEHRQELRIITVNYSQRKLRLKIRLT